MVGLLDIAPRGGSVTINGEAYPVNGLSAASIVQILRQFPELLALFGGAGEGVDMLSIAAKSEDALTAILAHGLGLNGQAEYEEGLSRLALDEKAEVFAAVLKETLPNGVVPFVQTLEKLMKLASAGEGQAAARAGKARFSKSQKS